MGGQFKDGFVNSLLGSVASEVGGLLNAEIAQLSQRGAVSDSQASTLRLLARATSSALRIVGSEDPAAGFAGDFLSGVLGDALQQGPTEDANPSGGEDSEMRVPVPEETRPVNAAPEPEGGGGTDYGLAPGDDGQGLRPGGGRGIRWGDSRAHDDVDAASTPPRPIYDFDPEGVWDPEAPEPLNAVDTPLAWLAPPLNPVAGGLGTGGYQVVRPDGAGGPPGYDHLYDLPTDAPGYRPADPGLGIRVPPFNLPVPPGIGLLTTLPMVGTLDIADYLMDRRASGILSDNLEAAGIARPADTDAHHMVPHRDARATEIRRLLGRFDIDINSADNGVFLPNKPDSEAPGSYHPRLNNEDYYRQLTRDFEGVSSRQEALDALRSIRDQLLNGTYPGSRPRPEK